MNPMMLLVGGMQDLVQVVLFQGNSGSFSPFCISRKKKLKEIDQGGECEKKIYKNGKFISTQMI